MIQKTNFQKPVSEKKRPAHHGTVHQTAGQAGRVDLPARAEKTSEKTRFGNEN